MHVEYRKEYSHNLGRDMEYKIFGHSGHSILVIPTQDKRFFEYEDEGMVGAVQYWIDRGDIRLICADAIDWETWSNTWGDCRWRLVQHERWFRYITEELVPRVRRGDETFIVTGCSLGGFHAANMFFRRPDLFDTLISLSGLYSAGYFFGDYHDDLTWLNSPQDYLPWKNNEDPFWESCRRRKMVLCVGQGPWEHWTLDSTRAMAGILGSHNSGAWVDFWGYDVAHDWPWWRKQMPYFLSHVL